MFGMRMWGIYEGKAIYGPLLVVGFLLWGISVLMTKHTVLEYLVICAFMGLAAVVYINSGEKGLLLYFALMLGMKGIDERALFKTGVAVGLSGMAVLTFLSAFGIIEDVAYVQNRGGLGLIFRRSLGFPHPNTLSSSFTILAIMIIYLVGNKDKLKVWITSAVLLIIALYLIMYSGSRTGLAITIGVLLLNLFYAYRNKIGIIEKIGAALIIPAIWVVTVVVPIFAPMSVIEYVESVDQQFGTRWGHGRYYFDNNTLTLFGGRLGNPKDLIYGIDLSQLYLLMTMGIVAFVVITLLWIMLIRDEVRENRVGELVITVSLLIMGVMDPFLYNIGFKNLAFVFMGRVLYKHLRELSGRVPDALQTEILIIKAGEKEVSIPALSATKMAQKGRMSTGGATGSSNKALLSSSSTGLSKKSLLLCVAGCAVFLGLSAAFYYLTPAPSYVLSDSNKEEHIIYDDLVGKTYSPAEIREIKSEGNIVLNYTDANEEMYAYYASESDMPEGSCYAPNAAGTEKTRRCVSIFFWGVVLISILKYMTSVTIHKQLQ